MIYRLHSKFQYRISIIWDQTSPFVQTDPCNLIAWHNDANPQVSPGQPRSTDWTLAHSAIFDLGLVLDSDRTVIIVFVTASHKK